MRLWQPYTASWVSKFPSWVCWVADGHLFSKSIFVGLNNCLSVCSTQRLQTAEKLFWFLMSSLLCTENSTSSKEQFTSAFLFQLIGLVLNVVRIIVWTIYRLVLQDLLPPRLQCYMFHTLYLLKAAVAPLKIRRLGRVWSNLVVF